mmetsp:Transcript_10423/g.15931  ORF Transcript_10423/g.15931 Transcript_10423/m.15931 type:complete len:278 (+) Transcript_10423:18-851(+)
MSDNNAIVTSSDEIGPKDEESDRLVSWQKRWEANRIGFHKDDVNEWLLQYGHRIIPYTDDDVCMNSSRDNIKILVPLCGKTVDMLLLNSQTSVERVVGVEGIRKALLEFKEEHPRLEIQPTSDPSTKIFERFEGKNITLLKGDFFDMLHNDVSSQFLSSFDVIWDRASIVAIDPSLRSEYVQMLLKLLKPGGKIMLIAVEKRSGAVPEALRSGPPYSLSEAEIRTLFSDSAVQVSLLEERDDFAANPEASKRFREAGVTSMYEILFEIEKPKVEAVE